FTQTHRFWLLIAAGLTLIVAVVYMVSDVRQQRPTDTVIGNHNDLIRRKRLYISILLTVIIWGIAVNASPASTMRVQEIHNAALSLMNEEQYGEAADKFSLEVQVQPS